MTNSKTATSGFVYLWWDRKRNMYYVGCHWGYEDDGYVCSSDRMKKAYKRRPETFKRRILSRNIHSKPELLEKEYEWLQQIKQEELQVKYYNVHNRKFSHWSEDKEKSKAVISKKRQTELANPKPNKNKGRKLSEEHKAALRGPRPEANVWNKGKSGYHVHSEESRKTISEKNKGQKRSEEFRQNLMGHEVSEATREKLRQANLGKESPLKGIPLSEEHKQKVSDSKMGHEVSQETRDKLSEMFTGRKGPNLGRKFSAEARHNMSEAAKRRKSIPWNKGVKTGPQSEETCQKKRLAKIGFIPWNKSLKDQNSSIECI